jgi:hypothetical protein
MSIHDARRIGRLRTPAGASLLLAIGALPSVAQAHPNPATPDDIRKIQTIEPRSGPAGTEVRVYTENLPLQARVVVGVGAIGTGFEELGEARQGEFGEVGATVTIPETATWDRPLVFIIFNGNFAPTGLSDPFHVTNEDGLIYREGELTDEGEGCVAMRDKDGYLYTLTGDLGGAKPGDAIAVEGMFSAESDCAQGETIRVTGIGPPAADGIR